MEGGEVCVRCGVDCLVCVCGVGLRVCGVVVFLVDVGVRCRFA